MCLPSFNGEAYIKETVSCILKQQFTDYELLVVDDNSTDETLDRVQSFDDPRIKIHKNPVRLGLVGNWNRCIELSNGKYICLFHQDDLMLPSNLTEKVRLLELATGVGLVHSNVWQIDKNGHVLSYYWYDEPQPEDEGIHAGKVYFEKLVQGENIICCPSVVARKESL